VSKITGLTGATPFSLATINFMNEFYHERYLIMIQRLMGSVIVEPENTLRI
jgi:hypothetical protein